MDEMKSEAGPVKLHIRVQTTRKKRKWEFSNRSRGQKEMRVRCSVFRVLPDHQTKHLRPPSSLLRDELRRGGFHIHLASICFIEAQHQIVHLHFLQRCVTTRSTFLSRPFFNIYLPIEPHFRKWNFFSPGHLAGDHHRDSGTKKGDEMKKIT